MKVCAYRDCEQNFVPARHNQKYCDSQCCKDEMSARARDSYMEKKARTSGAERLCKVCDSRLSRYNEDDVCGPCLTAAASRQRDEVLRIVNG